MCANGRKCKEFCRVIGGASEQPVRIGDNHEVSEKKNFYLPSPAMISLLVSSGSGASTMSWKSDWASFNDPEKKSGGGGGGGGSQSDQRTETLSEAGKKIKNGQFYD